MRQSERERLVKARDEAWEDERVAWGAVRGAKQAVNAARMAWEQAQVAHADKVDAWREADNALRAYEESRLRGVE